MANASDSQIQNFGASYDVGDGWEGDSGGDEFRGADVKPDKSERPASTTTPVARTETPARAPKGPSDAPPPPKLDVAEDDRIPDDDDEDAEQHAVEDEDEEQGEGDTDEERAERERVERESRRGGKETWKERQRRIARERAELSEARRRDEELATKARQTVTELETRKQTLERELADLQKQREKRGDPEPEAVAAAGDEPDWQKYEDEGKTLNEFLRDHAAWLRKAVAAERDAKLTAAIEEARTAGQKEATEALQKQQRAERESQIRNEFVSRRDKYFEDNPGLYELGTRTIGDLNSPFLNTVVVRHPQGMKLYHYLAEHPRQARYFRDQIEPMMTQPFVDAIRQAEDPTPLITFLTTKPHEVRRLAALPPADALLALGELNVTLRPAGEHSATSRPVAPPVTRAAPPLRSVAGRQSRPVSRDDDEGSMDDMTPAQWEKRRQKLNAARRR
jgi:hypothetical protein